MKYLIKKSVVFVVLFTTLLVNANETSSLRNLNDEKTTVLTLSNVKQGNQLLIKDVFGLTLYKESITKTGEFVKGFDLTSLPNGEYFFELNSDMEIKVIPFTVFNTTVAFNKEMETTISKPYVSLKDNYIYVSKLSLDKQPTEIKLYFDYDSDSYELIHSESLEDEMNIQRAYRISKSEIGKYKLVIKTEGRKFVEFL